MICFGRSRSRSSTTALCQRLRNGVGGGRVQRHVHLESFRSRDLGEALQPAIGEPAPDQDGRTGPVRFIGVIPNTSEAVAKMAKQLAKHRKARPLHNPMQCNRSKRAAMQDSSALQYLAIDTIHESTTNPRRTFEEAKLYGLPRRSPKSASPQVTPTCLLDPRRRHRPQPTISAGARTGRRRNRTCYPPSTLLVLLLPLLGLFVCLGFRWWRHSWGGILGQTRGGAGVMNRTVVVGAYGDGGSGTFAVDDGGFAAAHDGAGSASGFWVTFRFRGSVRAGRLPASALSGCGSRSRSGLTRDGRQLRGRCMKGKQPYWPDNLMKRYIRPVTRKAGITKNIGWHTFRHSFGTLLKVNGEDVKTVQDLLRHANSRITLDVYTQAVNSDKRATEQGCKDDGARRGSERGPN